MPAANIAYTRPPGAVGAAGSELFTIFSSRRIETAFKTGGQAYAKR